jgi:hypothetical protein
MAHPCQRWLKVITLSTTCRAPLRLPCIRIQHHNAFAPFHEIWQQFRMSMQYLIWRLIAATAVVDAVLLSANGIAIGLDCATVTLSLCLGGLSVAFQRIPSMSLLCSSVAQSYAFSMIAGFLSYGALAASPFPLADGLLSRADAAIGFDWVAWFEWINANPNLHFVLAKAYLSIPFQIFGLLFYFSYADANRVHEFLLAGILTSFITVLIMVMLPAVGAWSQHNVGIIEIWRDDIIALRSHTLLTVSATKGIVSFPSYHTVMGVLLVNMTRGRRLFPPVLALNVLMIASVLSEGAHYGVDLLSGLAVAFVGLGATHFLLVRRPAYPYGVPNSV